MTNTEKEEFSKTDGPGRTDVENNNSDPVFFLEKPWRKRHIENVRQNLKSTQLHAVGPKIKTQIYLGPQKEKASYTALQNQNPKNP